MRSLFLTNEFPPNIYGGAGVHVDYLSRELARSIDVEVRCFGEQDSAEGRLSVRGYGAPASLLAEADPRVRGAFDALGRGIEFAATPVTADVVHCHTWYAHFGGLLARMAYGVPMVVTVHSLEPLRPWKREQLGGGYDISSWVERTALQTADAVIAVSAGARDDILQLFEVDPERVHVIYNGIDTEEYHPATTTAALERFGVDPARPYVLFVGRITRQKGILHLVRAIPQLDPELQVVLCAGAPDTKEIAAEMNEAVREVQAVRDDVIWIEEMLDKPSVIELYSHAATFCCPSIYEPFGLINLEAMACETPVVASSVGGIREVVVHEETGLLVELEQLPTGEPAYPEAFERDLAAAINRVATDPTLSAHMGRAGRRRAVDSFGWSAIARQTIALYESVINADSA